MVYTEYQKLFIKFIQDILKSEPSISVEKTIEKSIDFFYDQLISKKKQKLIQTAFSKNLNQQSLDKILKNLDIESLTTDEALLFSYVMKLHPELNFDKYLIPRLTGLLRYYRFKNLNLIAHYSKIGKALNKQNIIPMILKGGAMKYLRPNLSRIMGDIDILVQKSEFNQIIPIIQDLGYRYEDCGHSIDLHPLDSDEGICDIHRFLEMCSDYPHKFIKNIYNRATKNLIFNVESFLPCTEDMVFIALTNMYKNIRNQNSINGIIFTLFDIDYLMHLKEAFDWDIVLDDIKKTNTYSQIYIVTSFINKAIPDFLQLNLFSDKEIKQKLLDFYYRDIFYVKYVIDLKYICKKLKFLKAIKHWNDFKYYVSMETKHFFFKNILKSKRAILFFLTLSKLKQKGKTNDKLCFK